MDLWKRNGPKVLVWFSCGAASACLAKLATAIYPASKLEVVYCDTSLTEHPDNLRFLKQIEEWIELPIKVLRSKRFESINEVFEKKKFLSNRFGAPCTVEMKKRVRFDYQLPLDIHCFGLTFDEKNRIEKFERNNPELTLHWILAEAQKTKQDCFKMLTEAGIELPAMYQLGYKNNNCIGCVKATSPSYLIPVRRDFPEVFQKRVEQSEKFNCKLVRIDGKLELLGSLKSEDQEVIEEDLSCGPQCKGDIEEEKEATTMIENELQMVEHSESKPRNERAPVYFVPQDDGSELTIIRNSKVGSCPREIWAYWRGIEPAAVGHVSNEPNEVLSEGHLHEAAVKAKLQKQGWKLDGFEEEFCLMIGPGIGIIGHADMGSAICPETGVNYVGEIKSTGVKGAEKFIEHGWDAFPSYPVQLSVAMIAMNKPGILWMKNRDNGVIYGPYVFDVPPVSKVEVMRKVLAIKTCVDSAVPPPCGKWRKTTGVWCRFSQLHDEERDPDEVRLERPDLEGLAREYVELGKTNRVIDEDENGNKVTQKSRRDEIRDIFEHELSEYGGNVLVCGSVTFKQGKSSMVFDEQRLKLEEPEIWKRFCTKEKSGSFRASVSK